ncbi:MAG: 2-polyprenylphenol 6-hydroxylase [Boseongicola sp. SB0673_bin_14]|nr:2-polyprenylphenol 6-hydroxylase [Boseongicola sp. SB0667_bin_21]MYI70415.1 2-polyprenylphenol 6-hydroxylase [Boseongicola sp. SB0673_bin_14]
MRGPHNIFRLVRAGATFERAGAMRTVLEAMNAPRSVRIAARVLGWPFKWLGHKGDTNLPTVTRALTAMGPAFIKLGQTLSTRPDVVGHDLAEQLRLLQDNLPPFPTVAARNVIEAELGAPVDELFSEFSDSVAAASIAQVHKARLAGSGEAVAVKVLRPRIVRNMRRDIDAFYFAARVIETLAPASRRLRPLDVVAHFEGVVMAELDLRLESANASEYAANAVKDEGLRVPMTRWDLSSRRVLTLDWLDGISLSDIGALDRAGHDRVRIAETVMTTFLSHALRDGYFHGDMHQGNLRVAGNGDLVILDFGIMGRIDAYTRRVYAEILIGFIRRDYQRVAEVHFEAGYVPRDRNVTEFAQALRAVGEPIFGMEASRISMGRLLSHLFEVTERFGMETRTELLLLQRTMVVVEGVARSLDPHVNIWNVARPTVERYIAENVGPKAVLREALRTVRVLNRFGPKLPEIAEDILIRQMRAPAAPDRRPWLGRALLLVAVAVIGFGIGFLV